MADLLAPDELGLFTELKSLRVEQIRKVESAVNLKVARALGVPRLPARLGLLSLSAPTAYGLGSRPPGSSEIAAWRAFSTAFDLLALRRRAVLDSAAAAEASVPTREFPPTNVSCTAAMAGVSRSCRIGYSVTCGVTIHKELRGRRRRDCMRRTGHTCPNGTPNIAEVVLRRSRILRLSTRKAGSSIQGIADANLAVAIDRFRAAEGCCLGNRLQGL